MLKLGQVNFCDAAAASCTDIHLVGTVQLTSAGAAVLRFRPGPANHSYKGVFLGTFRNGHILARLSITASLNRDD
jgi:hypothetical protein